ncbi:MAG: hypothetical protein AAB634_01440, partial [Patescibacteria group bacterium]
MNEDPVKILSLEQPPTLETPSKFNVGDFVRSTDGKEWKVVGVHEKNPNVVFLVPRDNPEAPQINCGVSVLEKILNFPEVSLAKDKEKLKDAGDELTPENKTTEAGKELPKENKKPFLNKEPEQSPEGGFEAPKEIKTIKDFIEHYQDPEKQKAQKERKAEGEKEVKKSAKEEETERQERERRKAEEEEEKGPNWFSQKWDQAKKFG